MIIKGVIGIDPGLDGALAFINDAGRMTAVVDMPTVKIASKNKTRRIVNAPELYRLLEPFQDISSAYVEHVHSMPNQSMPAMFNMGYSLGLLHATIRLAQVPMEEVRPVDWKRRFGLSRVKEASRQKALDLWPDFYDELKLKKNENRAEAMLIAQYAREKYHDR